MKALKLGILMFGMLAVISCQDSNQRNVENDEYAIDSPDFNNDMVDMNSRNANIDSEGTVIVEDSYMLYSTADMQGMYQELDMTQEQINEFESDYRKRMDAMAQDTTISMDKETLKPEMDESLKSILTADQYQKYDQWKMDNPNL